MFTRPTFGLYLYKVFFSLIFHGLTFLEQGQIWRFSLAYLNSPDPNDRKKREEKAEVSNFTPFLALVTVFFKDSSSPPPVSFFAQNEKKKHSSAALVHCE